MPKAAPTSRRVSSASSCVLTKVAANTFSWIEALEQATYYRGLSRAHLAGDDDEPLVLMDAVLEICGCTPVLLAAEIERRVGIELEGLAGQAIERLVHFLEKHAQRSNYRVFTIRTGVAVEICMANV